MKWLAGSVVNYNTSSYTTEIVINCSPSLTAVHPQGIKCAATTESAKGEKVLTFAAQSPCKQNVITTEGIFAGNRGHVARPLVHSINSQQPCRFRRSGSSGAWEHRRAFAPTRPTRGKAREERGKPGRWDLPAQAGPHRSGPAKPEPDVGEAQARQSPLFHRSPALSGAPVGHAACCRVCRGHV